MLKLKLENINKTFDGKNFVVKNFNLEVNNEDFVVLVGPSGCGKTSEWFKGLKYVELHKNLN